MVSERASGEHAVGYRSSVVSYCVGRTLLSAAFDFGFDLELIPQRWRTRVSAPHVSVQSWAGKRTMEFPAASFPPDRKWTGRIIIAVILGEAVWALIVSVMNNVIVPWLGDLMGPSAGLPTSFVQRPYNYPELFVSIFEVCIAGLVAAILNYFVERPQVQRTKRMTGPVVASPQQTFPEAEQTYSPRKDLVVPPSPLREVQHTVFRETSLQNQNQNLVAQSAPPFVP